MIRSSDTTLEESGEAGALETLLNCSPEAARRYCDSKRQSG